MENLHSISVGSIIPRFKTSKEKGLSGREAKIRQEKFGKNKLREEKKISRFKIFLEQFKSPLIYILIIAGTITAIFADENETDFLERYADPIIIFSAVFLNTLVGFLQENKASNTLKELKKIVKHQAEVLRGGNLKMIDSQELVPGDIVFLNPGDRVSADGRIIESNDLRINEMALTGEWLPAKKNNEVLDNRTQLADRDNMVYMGTVVENGKGKFIVTGTGLKTEIGKIAEMVEEAEEEKTPYQKKLTSFSKTIGIIIAVICVGIFIEGVAMGEDWKLMFETSVAVAVAAIPEGLPVAMTIILALGMSRILKRKGLVRKLVSAETLGSTSVIATDKTATLTEGKMKVSEISTISEILKGKEIKKEKEIALKTAVLCSEAFIENFEKPIEKWILRGRPTDKALLEAGIENKIFENKIEKKEEKIGELSFDPVNKYSASLHEISEKEEILYVLGAPDKIIPFSNLSKNEKEKLEEKLEEMAKIGLRIVATSYKIIKKTKKESTDINEEIKDLNFVSFIGLKDPVRKEVKKAMDLCRSAGMRPIMITGDHKLTAKTIAEELGFKTEKENIIEGSDLDGLSDEEFKKRIKNIEIYARVEPRHKIRIVEAWQSKNEVVAMTGDGINDAPALKKADVGIAIGSGTEVAKEASDLVLLNDSFSIIVAAVEEGRTILDNIRKTITYLLSDSFTEVILISVSILFGWPLPILAAQILWVNLIEDGPLGVSLAFEPKEKDVMKEKPQSHKKSLFTREMKYLVFGCGFITDILLLGLFWWLLEFSSYGYDALGNVADIAHIQAIIFTGLTIDSLYYIFSCKSLKRNLWNINPFSNKFLLFAWFFGVIMLLSALYFPPFQTLLGIPEGGLNFFDWKLIFAIGTLNVILIETTKWYFISRHEVNI